MTYCFDHIGRTLAFFESLRADARRTAINITIAGI
jgi:hypothetical protein